MNKRKLSLIIVFAALTAAVVMMPKTQKSGVTGGHAGPGAPGSESAHTSQTVNAGLNDGGAAHTAQTANSDAGRTSQAVFRVVTQTAQKGTLRSYLEMNGDVEADNTVEVFPDIAGKLVRLHVSLGSNVSKGSLIADIDPSKPGEKYEISPVYAPISGTVTSLPLKAGSTVSTSSVIGIIGDITNLQITAHIPERHIAVLKTGLKAELSFEAYLGETFSAHVFRISPLVDSVSRTKEVYAALDENDPRINAGMFAKIKLYTTAAENVIILPEDAIITEYGGQFVFILNNSSPTVEKRKITAGTTVDGMTAVLSGVSEGERVVCEGVTLLSDGVSVKDIGGAL